MDVSLAALFGDALAHWWRHQARFWKFTIPVAILLAAIPYLMLRGYIPEVSQWVQSGVRAFVDVLILYQWFNYALFDDWSARRNRMLQQKNFPWGAFLSVGFLAFWALHFTLSYGILSTWRQSGIHAPLAVQLAIVPVKEIVLATGRASRVSLGVCLVKGASRRTTSSRACRASPSHDRDGDSDSRGSRRAPTRLS